MSALRHRTVDANGIRIHLVEGGTGPPGGDETNELLLDFLAALR